MADDIVKRLRTVDEFSDAIGIMDAAADEIERLRAEVDAEGNCTNLLMLDISRLRSAGDALFAAISALRIQNFDVAVINAMHDWEKVRYG